MISHVSIGGLSALPIKFYHDQTNYAIRWNLNGIYLFCRLAGSDNPKIFTSRYRWTPLAYFPPSHCGKDAFKKDGIVFSQINLFIHHNF